MSIEKRKQKFIEKATKVHGDKYDYSKVNYISAKINVDIICKIHGVFSQSPDNHIHKHGCGRCNGSYRIDTKEFIDMSIKIHGDKYDYSITTYGKNNSAIVNIICKIHGEFKQVAAYHLDGNGCQKCAKERIKTQSDIDISTKKFIDRAEKVFGKNKFNYDLTEYKKGDEKVLITCKKHNKVFLQRPSSHLSGYCGCTNCKESKGERAVRIFLENNNIEFIQEKRFADCKVKYPLAFDFYIPTINTCVEYDGIQHFKPVERFGGIENYNTTKKFDKVKNKYCRINNIKLIRIPYYNLHKINDILNFML